MNIKELINKGFKKKYLISDKQRDYIENGDLISKMTYEHKSNIVNITMSLYIFYKDSENSEIVTRINVENAILCRSYSEEEHIELNYGNILNFNFAMFDKYLK